MNENTPRKTTCTNLSHPKADNGPIVDESPKSTFINLICPICGRSQGIRRIRKTA